MLVSCLCLHYQQFLAGIGIDIDLSQGSFHKKNPIKNAAKGAVDLEFAFSIDYHVI